MRDEKQYQLAQRLVGRRVRFAHERDDAVGYHCIGMTVDGMVALDRMSGVFGPHLFVVLETAPAAAMEFPVESRR